VPTVECLRALVLLVDTEVLEVILIDTGFAAFTVFALAVDLVFATIFGFTATFAFTVPAVLDFVFVFDLTAMIYILTG
jgi:hypothetical protein